MKRLALLVIAISFVFLLGAGKSKKLAVGAKAPAVKVGDASWVLPADSKSPATSDTVVLLEFWATWCGPCLIAMPEVQALHERYAKDGLTVIALTDEDRATVEPFLAKRAWSVPIALDAGETIKAFGVRQLPTTIVIAKDGTVAHVGGPKNVEPVIRKALGLPPS